MESREEDNNPLEAEKIKIIKNLNDLLDSYREQLDKSDREIINSQLLLVIKTNDISKLNRIIPDLKQNISEEAKDLLFPEDEFINIKPIAIDKDFVQVGDPNGDKKEEHQDDNAYRLFHTVLTQKTSKTSRNSLNTLYEESKKSKGRMPLILAFWKAYSEYTGTISKKNPVTKEFLNNAISVILNKKIGSDDKNGRLKALIVNYCKNPKNKKRRFYKCIQLYINLEKNWPDESSSTYLPNNSIRNMLFGGSKITELDVVLLSLKNLNLNNRNVIDSVISKIKTLHDKSEKLKEAEVSDQKIAGEAFDSYLDNLITQSHLDEDIYKKMVNLLGHISNDDSIDADIKRLIENIITKIKAKILSRNTEIFSDCQPDYVCKSDEGDSVFLIFMTDFLKNSEEPLEEKAKSFIKLMQTKFTFEKPSSRQRAQSFSSIFSFPKDQDNDPPSDRIMSAGEYQIKAARGASLSSSPLYQVLKSESVNIAYIKIKAQDYLKIKDHLDCGIDIKAMATWNVWRAAKNKNLSDSKKLQT